MPNIQDFSYILYGKNIFTTLDLVRAYNQIPMSNDSIEKTAVITPFGLFEFLRMPYGLRNSAQTFQRFVDQILQGLDLVFVYIDDILIASNTLTEHENHLRIVFNRLEKHGLTINPLKCHFGKKVVQFLGFNVSCEGLKPLPDRITTIQNYKKPTTVKELRRFLGIINFYRRHIKRAAEYQAPLTNLLHNKTKKNDNSEIQWSPEADEAFENCKQSLVESCTLAYPSTDAILTLNCDASNDCIGATLHQTTNLKVNQPLGFFSKKLTSTQKNYSTYDRELLALYAAVQHFRPLIEGRELIILTDHKPLIYAFTTKSNNTNKESPRRVRQLDFIAQFTTNIQYLQGNENIVADA